MVGKSSLQEIAILAIVREISHSNLEPGDSVQNLEYPGLSGRVDSTGFCPEKPKSIAEQASEVILTAELTIMRLKLTAWSPNPKGC